MIKQKCNKERKWTLDYINYQMQLQQDAIDNLIDIDAALERYNFQTIKLN